MTTWAALFDRAAAYDVDTESIRETLERQRENGGVSTDERDDTGAGDD